MSGDLATMLAVDPGGVHCGVATFETATDHTGWYCIDTTEYSQRELDDMLGRITDPPDVLIWERFQLYPDMADKLIGSEMETSQTIGILMHWAWQWEPRTQVVVQPASYQQPALGLLRKNKIASTAKRSGSGPHCLSAELHGWAYLFRNNLAHPKIGLFR